MDAAGSNPSSFTVPDGIPPELVERARRAYEQPPRAYHSFAHVEEVLSWHALVARDVGWRQPRETWLAALFHDVIYVAGRKDNEERSAVLAQEEIARAVQGPMDVARVQALIRLTAQHGRLSPADVDTEAALFLDMDMAILGAEPARFDAYDAGVATEYSAVVPGFIYRFNRRRFLQALLDAPRIYLSDYFQQRLDEAARRNLRRALGGG
ncbi:MAG: HD domain-containing protein [Myxococcota bacterium]